MTAPPARAAAVSGCLALAVLALSNCGASPTATPQKPSAPTSAEKAGGMHALIAAAKHY
ncbi:hypothetical protein ACWC0A_37015 [Streptomyces scopuliridis]